MCMARLRTFVLAGVGMAGSISWQTALADDYPTLELDGRIHLDYAIYDDDMAELGDGGEVRRARLGVEGLLSETWAYGLSVDFAGGDAEIKDALLAWSGLPRGTLTIGQFKQPFSLVNLTSSKYLTFIERPSPAALATDRRLGLGYALLDQHYTFAVSAYGQNVETGGEGLGAGARLTWTPLNKPANVIHLGAALAWEEAPDASNTVRFRARPESHVTDVRLIDTGTITGVDTLQRYGVEAAGVWGSFSVQAEYLGAAVNRERNRDVNVAGWYIFASYFLTGESRPYEAGVFGRVKPLADSGAWEMALRYSSFDLNDGTLVGGEQSNFTLGLNYYLTPQLKFQGNYTEVDSERRGVSDDPDILQFRVAFDF